jgi:hypothetical protein
MRRAGAGLAIALACHACGGRTPLLLGGAAAGEVEDASSPGPVVDAAPVDVAARVDVASFDASSDVREKDAPASCSTPAVEAALCQPGATSCCKFDVTWTCGSESYDVSGSCGPSPMAYEGVCHVNGQQVNAFTSITSTCPCADPSSLAAFAESVCGSASDP